MDPFCRCSDRSTGRGRTQRATVVRRRRSTPDARRPEEDRHICAVVALALDRGRAVAAERVVRQLELVALADEEAESALEVAGRVGRHREAAREELARGAQLVVVAVRARRGCAPDPPRARPGGARSARRPSRPGCGGPRRSGGRTPRRRRSGPRSAPRAPRRSVPAPRRCARAERGSRPPCGPGARGSATRRRRPARAGGPAPVSRRELVGNRVRGPARPGGHRAGPRAVHQDSLRRRRRAPRRPPDRPRSAPRGPG